MSEDTMKLLQECNSGCKMALNSLDQVLEYIQDDKLHELVDVYTTRHDKLEVRCSEILAEHGLCDEEPGIMAKAFSWINAEVKLMLNDDNHHIAAILMDGCNMGIQSISEQQHKYPTADKKVMDIAHDLVKCEEDFMVELKEFM